MKHNKRAHRTQKKNEKVYKESNLTKKGTS